MREVKVRADDAVLAWLEKTIVKYSRLVNRGARIELTKEGAGSYLLQAGVLTDELFSPSGAANVVWTSVLISEIKKRDSLRIRTTSGDVHQVSVVDVANGVVKTTDRWGVQGTLGVIDCALQFTGISDRTGLTKVWSVERKSI